MNDEGFGFEVARNVEPAFAGRFDPGFEIASSPEFEWWEVSLPHQCDRWVIASSYHYDEDDAPQPRMAFGGPASELIPQMEQFIAEAQAVLAELVPPDPGPSGPPPSRHE